MRIRTHTTVSSTGRRSRRTTVTRKNIFGVRHTVTYTENEEQIRRKEQADNALAKGIVLALYFLTAFGFIVCGIAAKNALMAFMAGFAVFAYLCKPILSHFGLVKRRYVFAAICLYLGIAVIAVSAHDFVLTLAAAAIGVVLMLPAIILLVIGFKRLQRDKDSKDDGTKTDID